MSEMQDLNFDDIETKEVRFTVQGSTYILREPSAEAGAWRRTKLVDSTEVEITQDEKGQHKVTPKRISGTGNIELEFLAMCIYPIDCHDGVTHVVSDKHVSLDVIKKWPDKLVNRLLDKHKEMTEDEGNPTSEPTNEQGSGMTS